MTFGRRAPSIGIVCASLATAGCAHLTYANVPAASGAGAFPTPTAVATVVPVPVPSASAGGVAPQACATQAPAATFVAMGGSIAPATVAPYGTLFGYTVAASSATVPSVAAPLVVRAGDTIQFVNVETASATPVFHSAVGFPGATAFPPVPVVFPQAFERPTGGAIGPAAWSSGSVAPQCFSPSFSVVAGTYYFGDATYYNLTNFRGVVVAAP
ncbi:MAG: hypothetical protein NVSMB21_17880 [Vulcanimicrobiaceae bacterium]